MVVSSDAELDCCMRVLSRSTGWRRTADRTPELSPAMKWNPIILISIYCSSGGSKIVYQWTISPI
jgi:hypothetical protein